MNLKRLGLPALSLATLVLATQVDAQAVAPADAALPSAAAEPGPQGFTSAAQARVYLSQNPVGSRAEAAFRAVAAADIAARNPDFDPAQIASGSALVMTPGAVQTPAEIEGVINATTPSIGARKGWF